ncbi:MAG: transcriptional regulator [candidate division WOR-3 bacterium]
MVSKKKFALRGMEEFGERLRMLRVKAGISQMKLAEKLGLNPKHGYKYILRLEKGLVPNPTLRTLTGFLNACGATWRDVADVLAKITLGEGELETSEPVVILSPRSRETAIHLPKDKADELKALEGERLWQLVKKAEVAVDDIFRFKRMPAISRRGYFSFFRSICTVIRVVSPDAWSGEFSRLVKQFKKQGLDERILNEIQKICLEVFTPVVRQSEGGNGW